VRSILKPHPSGTGSNSGWQTAALVALWLGGLTVTTVVVWQAFSHGGVPDPLAPYLGFNAAVLDIGVLVFREGLECILVLAAITAAMSTSSHDYRRPVVVGAGAAFGATLVTWWIAISVIDDLMQRISALNLQAATGLLAIVALLVVMNWFFHKVYWTGWISLHTQKKQYLLSRAKIAEASRAKLWWGFLLLGFTSLYREGFEVVLFLQSYRLKRGGGTVLYGVSLGLLFSGIVAVLTFLAHRRLPYRRMLILTGVMLGTVLLVMVGEEAQEMQLAHWIPTTALPGLTVLIPPWMGLWFSVFPTLETLAAQAAATVLVVGSYFAARHFAAEGPRRA
jgi:high-affinity iron transporter